jgi:hypothetical protein
MKVISYTVNLPRDGRVIDQLSALHESSTRARTTAHTGEKLVALPTEVIVETRRHCCRPTSSGERSSLWTSCWPEKVTSRGRGRRDRC